MYSDKWRQPRSEEAGKLVEAEEGLRAIVVY